MSCRQAAALPRLEASMPLRHAAAHVGRSTFGLPGQRVPIAETGSYRGPAGRTDAGDQRHGDRLSRRRDRLLDAWASPAVCIPRFMSSRASPSRSRCYREGPALAG